MSNDIGPKMTPKSKFPIRRSRLVWLSADTFLVEVFLENDVQKDKNKFH